MYRNIHSSLAHWHWNGILEEIRNFILIPTTTMRVFHIFVLPTLFVITVEKVTFEIKTFGFWWSDINDLSRLYNDQPFCLFSIMAEFGLINSWIWFEYLSRCTNRMQCRSFFRQTNVPTTITCDSRFFKVGTST